MYTIQIYGPFSVANPHQQIRIANDKDKALIAVLCVSEDLRRSRKWLASLLWGDNLEERAIANLRQSIWRIKLAFKGVMPLIDADRDTVWIRRENLLEVQRPGAEAQELLEGISIDEEPFEDWLRDQRLSASEKRHEPISSAAAHPRQPNTTSNLPRIAIFPPEGNVHVERGFSELVMNIVVKTLLEQRCVDILDLRQGIQSMLPPAESPPTLGLFLWTTIVDGHLQAMLTMKNLATGRPIWSRWLEVQSQTDHRFTKEFVHGQMAEIANTIHDQVHRYSNPQNIGGMFVAIQQVLTHSRAGQAIAKPWLTEAANESGVARAWLMYTFAVAHAERHGGLDKSALEELRFHCRKAQDTEPDNPIVRAIVGHINAFVFRNFEEAELHHRIARDVGWNQPVVWTLSAMHANYTDRPELAYRYSKRALTQSTFSPNKFYFEGPFSISCSLTNRHETAISVGKSILAKKPGFLAVMRHLVASQVHTGHLREARANIQEIRSKDPQFATRAISASDYPLPSSTSVNLINSALEISGL